MNAKRALKVNVDVTSVVDERAGDTAATTTIDFREAREGRTRLKAQPRVLCVAPAWNEGARIARVVEVSYGDGEAVERTRMLVPLVEPDPADQSDPLENYRQIREELKAYDPSLAERPEIIVVSKAELPGAQELAATLRNDLARSVWCVSAVTGKGLPQLIAAIWQELTALKEAAPAVSR